MKNNYEFLQELGIKFTGYNYLDNKNIRDFFGVYLKEPIDIQCEYFGKELKIVLKPNDCDLAFTNVVWSKLSLGERLRVLRWKQVEYMRNRGYKATIPDIDFVSKDVLKDVSYFALAREKSIEFNLDYLNNTNGYKALETMIHESIHKIDHFNTLIYLSKYAGIYLPKDVLIEYKYYKPKLLQLPLDGYLVNAKNGQIDKITDVMKEEFILIKNFCIAINSKANTKEHKREIRSREDFDKYLRRAVYFVTPLEERAYEGSIEYVQNLVLQNAEIIEHDEIDKKQYHKCIYDYKYIQGKKKELEKYYKMPLIDRVNMELIYEYNKERFGDDNSKYIAPELMKIRQKKADFFYDKRFKSVVDDFNKM